MYRNISYPTPVNVFRLLQDFVPSEKQYTGFYWYFSLFIQQQHLRNGLTKMMTSLANAMTILNGYQLVKQNVHRQQSKKLCMDLWYLNHH